MLVVSQFVPAYAADSDQAFSYRYNVVIVNDASGSLQHTDPDNLRGSAAERFVAVMANGNKTGAVAFDEGTPLTIDLADLNTTSARKNFAEQLSSVAPGDWTNIGAGLSAAVDMLNNQRDDSLPSIIILLSDGNTDMSSDDEYKESKHQEAEAIDAARSAGYKIYAVSLNADGTADSSELKQIADATGGEFREVTSADDLSAVYDLWYSMLYRTSVEHLNGTFTVPSVGVEEANILMKGNPEDFSFTDPNGNTITSSDLAESTYTSDSLVAVKLSDPTPGVWHYTIVPENVQFEVDYIPNMDVTAQITSSADGDSLSTGDSTSISVQLLESGSPVSADQYANYTGTLTVSDASGNSTTQDLTLNGDALTADVVFPSKGTYTLQATVSGEGSDYSTDALTFNVGNSAPTSNGDLEETIKLWPFLIDNTTRIDLSNQASDREDSTLAYSIDSTAFTPDDYELDGSTLVMKNRTHYSLDVGSFTIRATDSDGASCTFNVKINSINIGRLTLIAIIIGVVVALAAIGILTWLALNKRFYGTCYVRPFDNMTGQYFEEAQYVKSRGRIKLASFGVDLGGLDPNSYFQASGKDYVEYVFKKPVFMFGQQVKKKVKVEGTGSPVRICATQDGTKGVELRFVSTKLNGGGAPGSNYASF